MGTSVDALLRHVTDARERTLELVADLTDQQLLGPRLAIVNPLLWEIGHVAWFQEYWVLRHGLGERPVLPPGDSLYDSSAIPHDTRWDLPLPTRAETLDYLRKVRDEVVHRLSRREPTPDLIYLALYACGASRATPDSAARWRDTAAASGLSWTRRGSGAVGKPS